MLEINVLRDEPRKVKQDLVRRGMDHMLPLVDEAADADFRWRKLKKETDSLRHAHNELTDRIKLEKASGNDISHLISIAKENPIRIKSNESGMAELESRLKHILMRLPNILHPSVPKGSSEKDNVVERSWGTPLRGESEPSHHGELAVSLKVADFERAVRMSGSGFYFLKGDLALMDMALQSLAVRMLSERGYELIIPPLIMMRKPYEGATDLSDFENVMYRIEGHDSYLIATSEHPMAAMRMGEIIEPDELPLRLCGVSPCFRKEIGKHGLDERGLFRVHQFNKVEQFVYCKKEDSWDIHEQLISNAEDYMKELAIPYQVVNVCTADMGTVAAKKYDLEGYSPRQDKFIELVSCSNCTSYQAARLGIRTRAKDGTEPVHTLNSTMVATSRTLRLILENYQGPDGSVEIPKALRPYMLGKKEIIPP